MALLQPGVTVWDLVITMNPKLMMPFNVHRLARSCLMTWWRFNCLPVPASSASLYYGSARCQYGAASRYSGGCHRQWLWITRSFDESFRRCRISIFWAHYALSKWCKHRCMVRPRLETFQDTVVSTFRPLSKSGSLSFASSFFCSLLFCKSLWRHRLPCYWLSNVSWCDVIWLLIFYLIARERVQLRHIYFCSAQF